MSVDWRFARGGRSILRLVVGALALGLLTSCATTFSELGAGPSGMRSGESVATSAPAATLSAQPPSSSASASPASSPSKKPVAQTCPTSPGRFVETAPGKAKTVALTFDDGPGPADRQIVAILERHGIHATFFVTGRHVAADPAGARLLADSGQLLAVHSWDHDYPRQVPGGWSQRYLSAQFARTAKEITTVSGQTVCFVRPPGGFLTNVLPVAANQRLTAVLWSVDSEDWKQPSRVTVSATDRIVAKATATGGRQHPIVLMHSAKASHESEGQLTAFRGNTVAALPSVIRWYQSHGYRFVRLDGKP